MHADKNAPARGIGRGAKRTYCTRNSTPPAGIEGLLSRLDGVKSTGADSWIAQCPAHKDKSPSLSVRTTDDKVLVHCHAGCTAADIVAAVGLTLADLYNEALPAQARRELAIQANRRDLEAAVDHELLILAQTLGQRVADRQIPRDRMPPEWVPMPPGRWEREIQAVRRLMRLLPRAYGRELAGRVSS